MKTPQELFKEYATWSELRGEFIHESNFIQALSDYRESIIEKIDDEIKRYDVLLEADEIYALTELKEEIQSIC